MYNDNNYELRNFATKINDNYIYFRDIYHFI